MFKNMYDKALEAYKVNAMVKLNQIVLNEEVTNHFFDSAGKEFLQKQKTKISIQLAARFDGLNLWQSFIMYRYLKLTLSKHLTEPIKK